MKHVLIIGENELSNDYIKLISSLSNMKIIAIVKEKEQNKEITEGTKHYLKFETLDSLDSLLQGKIDMI